MEPALRHVSGGAWSRSVLRSHPNADSEGIDGTCTKSSSKVDTFSSDTERRSAPPNCTPAASRSRAHMSAPAPPPTLAAPAAPSPPALRAVHGRRFGVDGTAPVDRSD